MRQEPWDRVGGKQLALFGAGLAVFLVLAFRSERGFIFGLDHANLLFHEAGHPIMGLFSRRLEPYGGTFGQLFFPAFLAVRFWRQGAVLSLAGAGIWFWENFLNIARYMEDARQLKLPLVGGGDHDWNTILARWEILHYDTRIATGLRIVAWTGIGLVCAWVLWRAWCDLHRDQEEAADPVERLLRGAERGRRA